MAMDNPPIFCHRCGAELQPGSGDFYLVKIEAFADPFPPVIELEATDRDVHREIGRLAEALNDLSPQEAMDQVYRRLTLYLCTACYRRWIENPAGA